MLQTSGRPETVGDILYIVVALVVVYVVKYYWNKQNKNKDKDS